MTLYEKLMDFRKYCKNNKLDPSNATSAKMFYYYKEAEAASTDCNIKQDTLSKADFNKACQALEKANVPMWTNEYNAMIAYGTQVSFAPIPQAACPKKDCSVPCQNKGNNPMYVDNDKHIESSKINYLTDRASIAYSKKRGEMIPLFNLDTPAVPATPELLVEAITAGKYQIKPKAERNQYDRVTNQIIWRSADIKEDQAGYEKALNALSDIYQDIKDSIAVGTPADSMVQIKALDAWTPTVGNA